MKSASEYLQNLRRAAAAQEGIDAFNIRLYLIDLDIDKAAQSFNNLELALRRVMGGVKRE